MKTYTITVNGNVYDVTVEEGATVIGSVVMQGSKIKKGAHIENVIIDILLPDLFNVIEAQDHVAAGFPFIADIIQHFKVGLPDLNDQPIRVALDQFEGRNRFQLIDQIHQHQLTIDCDQMRVPGIIGRIRLVIHNAEGAIDNDLIWCLFLLLSFVL